MICSVDDGARGAAGPRRGFWMARLFPVEGDSAVAELWHDDEVWADVRLEGIRLGACGEDRIATCTVMVRWYVPAGGAGLQWFDFPYEQVSAQLSAAREWLLDNECGRTPVQGDEPLSAAGHALSTASTRTIEQFLAAVPAASHPDPPDAGTGSLSVALISAGPTPIALIRQIRILTGYGLMDARALVAALPAVVMTGLEPAAAAEIGHTPEAAGATVEIR